ncbi:transcriptional regulator [Actinosynnema sp. CA-299493]
MDHEVKKLVARARQRTAERPYSNRFLDLLDNGALPVERLRQLAAELHRLVASDRRSFTLLASRFPESPAGDFYLTMAQGEGEALRLLSDFAAAVDVDQAERRAHEPLPLAQVYPAYLAQVALGGGSSAVALALLANVAESGSTYRRVADALQTRYGFSGKAVGHFRFFGETPDELLDQAEAVVAHGLAAGEDPDEAVRTARLVSVYESLFWDALAEGITES